MIVTRIHGKILLVLVVKVNFRDAKGVNVELYPVSAKCFSELFKISTYSDVIVFEVCSCRDHPETNYDFERLLRMTTFFHLYS